LPFETAATAGAATAIAGSNPAMIWVYILKRGCFEEIRFEEIGFVGVWKM
jgi:hypothetical protein